MNEIEEKIIKRIVYLEVFGKKTPLAKIRDIASKAFDGELNEEEQELWIDIIDWMRYMFTKMALTAENDCKKREKIVIEFIKSLSKLE
jgi:hypothetical protein